MVELTTSAGAPIAFGRGCPLVPIAGPCVIESAEHAHFLARELKRILGAFVFKASYDKANRSSGGSYRGPGLTEGLRILADLRREGYAVLTDVHDVSQVATAAEAVDIIQIPAFLCRQTDLLLEAGRSGRVVNIKKGQFVAPHDIHLAAEKVASTGNTRVLLTERGSSFGYNNLVVDMRGLAIMRESGWPVIFDATHSVQTPGGAGTASRNSSHPSRGPPWLPASTAFFSKCTRLPSGRCRTARMHCGWTSWPRFGRNCGAFTMWFRSELGRFATCPDGPAAHEK